jgi:hypothetical protein
MKSKDAKGRWEVSTPHKLFDCIREMYNLKTDAELAHILSARTPMISKIRNRIIRITPALIIAVHEQTNIPIAKIKEMSK